MPRLGRPLALAIAPLDPLKVRVTIKDRQALDAVNPAAISAYLGARRWTRVDDVGPWGGRWTRKSSKHGLLVAEGDPADRILRLADLIADLEREERRSQLAILLDLAAGGDVDIRRCAVCAQRVAAHPLAPKSPGGHSVFIRPGTPLEDGKFRLRGQR